MSLNDWNNCLTGIPGIGTATAERLKGLKIQSVADLLFFFPRRYLDRRSIQPLSQVKVGEDTTVVGEVRKVQTRRTRRRKTIVTATIFDGTGYIDGLWFNQPYIADMLSVGLEVAFSGKVKYQYKRLQIVNPSFDILGKPGGVIHTSGIIPLYPGSSQVSSPMLRRIIKRALERYSGIPDYIPQKIRKRRNIMELSRSLEEIHFPSEPEALRKARRRMIFDELFAMQVGLALRKARIARETSSIPHDLPGSMVKKFWDSLPFKLTNAQSRCWSEISKDMERGNPMNRLLQGEVGSGKTLVAVLALLLTVENGCQGAMMAPTEVLALQHYRRVSSLLRDTGVRTALLTSASGDEALGEEIARGEVDIVVGTHALIQRRVKFARLGLTVIDEQHRFGVRQRITLKEKGDNPHVLIMTATPIPRTLSLTLYGDLDVSILDELPPGRKDIHTVVMDSSQRDGAFQMVKKEVGKGRQAFVVCPLVDESNKLEARAASDELERLRKAFPELRIGVLHGQMKSEEKDRSLEEFRRGEVDILVTTSVVEVGVDIPNATVMVVENADRFGLAQLHQLRGRIGRGEHRSLCILFAKPSTDEGVARMEAIAKISDGFKLAEADLAIRGEGEVFGARQSGLPDLRIARLTRDYSVLKESREEAFQLVKEDPQLEDPDHAQLLSEVRRRFSENVDWLFHG